MPLDSQDNPRAVLDYLLAKSHPSQLELVWLVRTSRECRLGRARHGGAVKFMPAGSLRGLLAFATSAFVFYSHHIYPFARARAGQKLVNLWHGMPIKRIGYLDERDRHAVIPATHSIATSRYFQGIVAASFGLSPQNVFLVGLPRNDWQLQPDLGVREQLAGSGRLVLWLPTFRRSSRGMLRTDGRGSAVSPEILQALDKRLAPGARLVVKLHPNDALNDAAWPEFGNVSLLKHVQVLARKINLYRLIGAADAVITDYSSVAVDAAGYGKPVALYAPDVSEYARGFNDGAFERLRAVAEVLPDLDAFAAFVRGEMPPPAVDPDALAEIYGVGKGRTIEELLGLLGLDLKPGGSAV